MNLQKTKIETSNLFLIPINESYIQDIFNEFTNEITLFMFPKAAENIEETKQFVSSSINGLNQGNNLQLVALKKTNMEFVGCIGLHYFDKKDPELGLWIKKSAHGNGYGLEAITGLILWAKENIEFEYLRYPVDKRNYASRRIPEGNGGIIKKEFKTINQSGFELDEIEYWIYK